MRYNSFLSTRHTLFTVSSFFSRDFFFLSRGKPVYLIIIDWEDAVGEGPFFGEMLFLLNF